MGYEHGSVFIYDRKLWFFEGYSTNVDMYQTLKLRGVDGFQVEALESKCTYLISPSEIDHDELERQQANV